MALTKVSTDGVKDDAITSGKIPANAVGASELADNAVDTNAIANNAVTAGKTSGVQTTINNNADNRILTGTGTANTIQGEPQLTFDSNGLLRINAPDGGLRYFFGETGNSQSAQLSLYNSSDQQKVRIAAGDGSNEAATFFNGGIVLLGNTSSFDTLAQLHIERANNTVYSATTNTSNGINIYNNSATNGGFCGIQLGSSSSSGHYGSTLLQNVSVADGYSSDFVIKTRFSGSYAERLRVTSNGLTFNGDTAAANALNDYEEGTWTPGNNDMSVTVHYARYTKVGRFVHIVADVEYASTPSDTSQVGYLTGLPFTNGNKSVHQNLPWFGTSSANNNQFFNTWFTPLIFANDDKFSFLDSRYGTYLPRSTLAGKKVRINSTYYTSY